MNIRKSLVWTAFGQIVLFSSQILTQIIISRSMDPYLVGISSIAFAITDLINIMQIFGLRNYLIREVDLTIKKIRSTFTINILLSLLTAISVIIIAEFGVFLYKEQAIGDALRVTALIPLVIAFEITPGALLQRDMNFAALALASSAKALVTAGVTVGLVFLDYKYMSIPYGALCGVIVSTSIINAKGSVRMHWGLSLYDWRRITTFGIQMFGVGGVNTISARIAEISIGRILGLSDLAIFSRASALNNLLWTNVHTVFTKVVFSAMAEERRRVGSFKTTYLKTMDMVTAILWPAFAGLAIYAGPIVYLLYGEKWLSAAPILSIFAIAAIGATSITMTWEVFVIWEKTAQQMRIETLRSIGSLLCTIFGAAFNIVGAAFGRIGDVVIANILYRRPLLSYTNTSNVEIFSIYRRSLLLTIAAIIPGVFQMSLWDWNPHQTIFALTVNITLGFLSWLIAAYIFHKDLFSSIIHLSRDLLKRKESATLECEK